MTYPSLTLALPSWIGEHIRGTGTQFSSVEERMSLVVELSRLNIAHQTGGPFGAAIFRADGLLIAPGVNLVESSCCSLFHAEMVAVAMAQQLLQTFDLGGDSDARYELYASTEPCAMCLGAVPWSGVRSLVSAARDEDARAIGFDEGAKSSAWVVDLEQRGITVTRDVLRSHAVEVLQAYAEGGGLIYNGRSAL